MEGGINEGEIFSLCTLLYLLDLPIQNLIKIKKKNTKPPKTVFKRANLIRGSAPLMFSLHSPGNLVAVLYPSCFFVIL